MELSKARLVTFGKSSKGRVEGANALKQRLIGNTSEDGERTPAIRFFKSCIHTIRTIPMLAHDKRSPETYDTTGEDHAADSIVYACLSRPWKPTRAAAKPQRDKYRRDMLPSVWTV